MLLCWLFKLLRALSLLRLPFWQEETPVVISETLDLSSMPVDDSYTGPRMEGVFLTLTLHLNLAKILNPT